MKEFESSEYIPKNYPVDLLSKDWSQRKLYFRYESKDFFDKLHDFEVREDDVWVVTLPKCGTTWMQEMVWLLANDCDFETAKSENLESRSPGVESINYFAGDVDAYLKNLHNLKSPRVFKTHLPLPLLPKELWSKKPKVIYVYRDPKDAFLSYYYFRQNFGSCLNTSLSEYVSKELADERRTNGQINHVVEFYSLRNEPWVHYTSFERMKKDLRGELLDICRFLNKNLDEETISKLLKHLSFEEMKKNLTVNHVYEIEQIRKRLEGRVPYRDSQFMRKGQVGDFKEEMTPETVAEINQWLEEGLKPYNLKLTDLLLL